MKPQRLNIVFLAFALAYLTFSLRAVVVFFDYQINYTYISQVLCENKDKPELECNGKCHLMKEMADTSSEKDTEGTTPSKQVRLTLVETNEPIFEFSLLSEHQIHNFPETRGLLPKLQYAPLTPPPELG